MDVVGPLERSKTGNRYLLVITDYATRYPEVFPLKIVRARNVAICLVQLFSRVGFPRTIVTDQGSNFMSKLLKQVYQLLGIKGLRTTPYHPQTDGLVERFNQTLKQMLRKFVTILGLIGTNGYLISYSHIGRYLRLPWDFPLLNCCMAVRSEDPCPFWRKPGKEAIRSLIHRMLLPMSSK